MMCIMPWPKQHKRETHERIVQAAAAAFREHGVAQVGVAEIMRRAGLTHGGFYAHFASKDDLVAEALAHASAEVAELLASAPHGASPNSVLGEATAYLSRPHLTHPERGCPVAALGPELARSSHRVRKTLAAEIRKRLQRLYAAFSPSVPAETQRREAAGALACMVGGLILARGLTEPEALEFLKDCRAFLHGALANSGELT